jgi:hypothetical protein
MEPSEDNQADFTGVPNLEIGQVFIVNQFGVSEGGLRRCTELVDLIEA